MLRALLDRNPGLDPSRIDDVWFGNANGAGEENRNVARMAVLLAGMATSVPASTVNRLCGSGLEAVFGASRALAVGDAAVTVAGGVESMSRAPWVMLKPQTPYPRGHETMHSTTLGWRMVNPRMPEQWTVSLGESAQMLADRYGISREDQDEFALTSHLNAAKAWANGVYDNEIAQVEGAELERDETIRPDASTESLARLKPAFRSDGSVTAGNSSPLNDGAAALLLTDESGLAVVGGDPIARLCPARPAASIPTCSASGPCRRRETP